MKRLADKDWLIKILYCIEPNNEIFSRVYVYKRPQRQPTAMNVPAIGNEDGFFDNLPELDQRRRGRQLRLPKSERQTLKLATLQAKQAAMEAQIALVKA